MTKRIKLFLLSFVAVLSFAGATPLLASPVLAAGPFDEACATPETQQSDLCGQLGSTDTPAQTTSDIVSKIANIIAFVGGLLAIIFIMINGVTMIMSQGDSAKTAKTRDGIIYASIGLVVIALARVIVAAIMRFI